jgi:hypothetical protein
VCAELGNVKEKAVAALFIFIYSLERLKKTTKSLNQYTVTAYRIQALQAYAGMTY